MLSSSEVKWRVNRHPRFTALEMGEYMVADDAPRETILRNMRFERLAPTLMYRHLYRAIPRFLASPMRDRSILDQCRFDLETERTNATSPRAKDNCTYALRALDAFERSLNALPLASGTLDRAPAAAPLRFNGVSVSVQPTAHIRVRRPRGVDLIGALLVDVAKGADLRTDDAKARASRGMLIATMLRNQYVVGIFPGDDPKPSAEHCIVFHAYRQETQHCPANYRRVIRNLEAVCSNISRGWDAIEPPRDFDPAYAIYRN
jgi:hypothetical protein